MKVRSDTLYYKACDIAIADRIHVISNFSHGDTMITHSKSESWRKTFVSEWNFFYVFEPDFIKSTKPDF